MAGLAIALTMLAAKPMAAESVAVHSVPVRRMQGSFHGFLVLKTVDGKTIASGDLIQVSHGDRVTARLVFHFHDGSIDDETTIFTQHKVFRLISDHHIQRGPSYPEGLDMTINAATGKVSYVDKEGKTQEEELDPGPDDCNGLFIPLLMNMDPSAPIRLPIVVPTPRPRLVHLVFSADGEDPVSIGGVRQRAMAFRLHFELGGVVGVVAPIIGKQPADVRAWILGGEAPAFVKGEGQFYEGGPIWRIELVAPVFPTKP